MVRVGSGLIERQKAGLRRELQASSRSSTRVVRDTRKACQSLDTMNTVELGKWGVPGRAGSRKRLSATSPIALSFLHSDSTRPGPPEPPTYAKSHSRLQSLLTHFGSVSEPVGKREELTCPLMSWYDHGCTLMQCEWMLITISNSLGPGKSERRGYASEFAFPVVTG